MSGTKGMLHYPREIKQKAVKLYLEAHHSYGAIAEELGIRLRELSLVQRNIG